MMRSYFRLLGPMAVAALLGAMALMTATAQAEPTAKWLILDANGVVLTMGQLPAQFDVSNPEAGRIGFKTEILKTKVEISCTTTKIIGGELIGEGSSAKGAKIKFTAYDFGGCAADFDFGFKDFCLKAYTASLWVAHIKLRW